MSMLPDLVRLVSPPAEPVDGDGEWRRVWTSLGCRLPPDYQELVDVYGLGSFDDLVLWTPFTGRTWANIVVQARGLLTDYDEVRAIDPTSFPYPLFPEEGGVLPWASTGDGDWLCWLTGDEPDRWPIVEWNSREGSRRHDVGAVQFLVEYLSGARDVLVLRPPPPVPWFDPYRELVQVSAKLAGTSGDPYRDFRQWFAPTADRAVWDGGDGNRQDSFKALDRGWLVTFNTDVGYGASDRTPRLSVWISCPPADVDDVRAAVQFAAEALGMRALPI